MKIDIDYINLAVAVVACIFYILDKNPSGAVWSAVAAIAYVRLLGINK